MNIYNGIVIAVVAVLLFLFALFVYAVVAEIKEHYKLRKQLAEAGIGTVFTDKITCSDCNTTECEIMKEDNYDLCCICAGVSEICDECWDRYVDRKLKDFG